MIQKKDKKWDIRRHDLANQVKYLIKSWRISFFVDLSQVPLSYLNCLLYLPVLLSIHLQTLCPLSHTVMCISVEMHQSKFWWKQASKFFSPVFSSCRYNIDLKVMNKWKIFFITTFRGGKQFSHLNCSKWTNGSKDKLKIRLVHFRFRLMCIYPCLGYSRSFLGIGNYSSLLTT